MASSIKKCMFFQKTSAVSNQLARRSPPKLLSLQAGQQKQEKSKTTQQHAVMGVRTGLPASPTLPSHSGAGHGLTFPTLLPGKGPPNPHFPLPCFHLAAWGVWSYGTEMFLLDFKLVQHFFPLKSSLLCFLVLYCALLLLM